jgi:hypothetical protein
MGHGQAKDFPILKSRPHTALSAVTGGVAVVGSPVVFLLDLATEHNHEAINPV